MHVRYKPRPTIVVVLIVAALLATACGSSDPAEPSEAAQGTSQAAESPLGDLIGVPLTDDAAMQDYVAQAQRDAENSIAECMRAEGFEYVPVDPSQSGFDISFDAEDRNFAEQYGFGLITGPLDRNEDTNYRDPNEEYIDSLVPAEREQFFTSLYGEPGDGEADPFSSLGGCRGIAFDEAFAFERIFDQFGDEVEEVLQAFESDPRIVEASAGWSTCMAEAGYGYSDKSQALQDIAKRYEEVLNTEGTQVGDAPASVFVSDDGSDMEMSGVGDLTVEGQRRVDKLVENERAIAVASFDCDAPLREIEPAVQVEYEQRFVDEHGDAVRAALAGDE